MTSVLLIPDIEAKLAFVEQECRALQSISACKPQSIPAMPARDIHVRSNKDDLPVRSGLNTNEGQAHLLHDLANIELQAMELGIRTLHEFPNAPTDFRNELIAIVLEEASHLELCLNGINRLGYHWGNWPVHFSLWNAVSHQDTLIDRILIVHCYLEGSGLDSGDAIVTKLSGVKNHLPKQIVRKIADDELKHVQFGLKWFRYLCLIDQLPPEDEFSLRLMRFRERIPPRFTKISYPTRERAGFSKNEILSLQNLFK